MISLKNRYRYIITVISFFAYDLRLKELTMVPENGKKVSKRTNDIYGGT